MSSFSTIETIIDENNDITLIAAIENILKCSVLTPTEENVKGIELSLAVDPESFPMKLMTSESRRAPLTILMIS